MTIYSKFFEDELHLIPSNNELLNLSKYKYLNSQLENQYSEHHIDLQKKLYKKYLTLIRKKQIKTLYDKCLEYICTINLSSYNYNFHLTTLNHQENIIEHYVECASGHSIINFENKQSYHNFINKITNLDCIVNSIIKNMERGISLNYTMPKLIAKEVEDQFKSILKNKSYRNNNVKYDLGYNYNDKLDDIFIPILNKLIK